MPENKFDIIISGGTLLTMSAGMDIIEDCFVGIQGGTITEIGPRSKNGATAVRAREPSTLTVAS